MAYLHIDRVPLQCEVDIVVAGAGSASCCAALAARETRTHSVLLLERYGFAGGTSTQVLDTFYGFFTPGETPRKVVGGLPDRVVDALDAAGCVSTVAVRVADIDPSDASDLTAAEQEGRRQAFIYEAFLRTRVPGFAASHIIGLSHQIGVRESRRVYGEYRLTRDDCFRVARFDDTVLLCGAPVEDHRPSGGEREPETEWAYIPGGGAYDVPYRTLVPRGRDEIWVAGRCFSATHDAHASCRSMAQTMSMGAATGFAAAISLELHCGAREVPVDRLRHRLRETGAVLEPPRQTADTSRNGWKGNRR